MRRSSLRNRENLITATNLPLSARALFLVVRRPAATNDVQRNSSGRRARAPKPGTAGTAGTPGTPGTPGSSRTSGHQGYRGHRRRREQGAQRRSQHRQRTGGGSTSGHHPGTTEARGPGHLAACAVPVWQSRQISPSRIVESEGEDGCTVARLPSGCGPSIAGGAVSPQAACAPGAGHAGRDRLRCDNNHIALACQPSGGPTLQAHRFQRID